MTAIDAGLKRFADRPALSFNGTTSTYNALDAAATRLANAYRTLGVERGDRVLCQLPNHPKFVIAAAAAWKQGAIHVGADRDLTPSEIGRLVALLTPAILLTTYRRKDHETAQVVMAARNANPRVHIIFCDEDISMHGCYSWSDLMALPGTAQHRGEAVRPEDPAVILLTSGTTGTPKAVIRYHGQLLDHWTKTATLLRASSRDRHLVQLPLSYGFGFGLAVAGLLTGGSLVLIERFSPETILQILGSERITILNGTPTHFRLLLDRLNHTRHDVSSLRAGAGSAARFPPPLLKRIFEDLRIDFVHTYGCSEGLGWKTVDKDEMLRGSVGRPPSDRLRVVGSDGNALPSGEIGEVAIRKTHPVHYWQEAPSNAGRDPGWHYMGDRGVVDDAGYLYILGRSNDQINRGGLKVEPGEIEPALWTHWGLFDAAVIGIPDSVHGEIVCACVVPEVGSQPSLREIRDFLAGSLARHKLPEKLCVLERIPRTRIGKVDRPALQSLVAGNLSDEAHLRPGQETQPPDNS